MRPRKSNQINLRCSPELYAAAKEAAATLGITLAEHTRHALAEANLFVKREAEGE